MTDDAHDAHDAHDRGAAPRGSVEFRTSTDAEARALLARQHVGRIAFSLHDHVDIEPVHYVLDGPWIYGRTSPGRKLATLAHHPWCAFEVDDVRGPLDWESVVVHGTFYRLDPGGPEHEAHEHALVLVRALVPHSLEAGDPTPHRTVLFRIHANEMHGRAARPLEAHDPGS